MMKQTTWKGLLIGWGCALAAILWFFAKMAMAWKRGITFEGWQDNLIATLKQPFTFAWNDAMSLFLWLGLILWSVIFASAILYTGKWRRGAEHGSANWGNIRYLRKQYMRTEGDDMIEITEEKRM